MVYFISFGVCAMFFAVFCFSKTFLFWVFALIACVCFMFAQRLWEKHIDTDLLLCRLENFLKEVDEEQEGENQ